MKRKCCRWLAALAMCVILKGQPVPTVTREYIYLGDRVVAVENSAGNVQVTVNCDQAVAVGTGETRQCAATVSGTSNQTVTWSLESGVGTVNASTGTYTAPSSIGGQAAATAKVKATSAQDGTKVGTVDLTVAPVLAPASQSVSSAGQQGLTITVTRSGSWTATTSDPLMIQLVSGTPGSGPGVLTYSVTQNTSQSQRTATLTVAGVAFLVTQSAAGAATATLTPSSASVGADQLLNQTIQVTATGTWTATSNVGWAHVAPTQGSDNGLVTYSIDPNPSASQRSGMLTIGNAAFSIVQAGCSIGLNPVSASVGGDAGTSRVEARSGCASYTVTSDSPSWLTVVSAPAGGSGVVDYHVSLNSSGTARTGHLWIGNIQFTVTQDAGASYEITPTVVTLYQGNSYQFNVYRVVGNTWTNINGTVNWSVTPSGFGVVSNGMFTAPSYVASGQSAQVVASVPSGPTLTATVNFLFLSPPGSATISPSSGSGTNQQFNAYLYFSSLSELSNNPYRHILFNTTTSSTANSCYVVWYTIGTNGELFVGNDQGTGFVSGPSSMPYNTTTPPSVGPENSQCSLDINGSNQRFEGSNYLRLMMMTYFKTAFVGNKNVYYRTGNESTWQQLGTWTIPAAVNGPQFSPSAGNYAAGQAVPHRSTTAGATLRYTTDGTTPSTTAGTIYTGPITLVSSRTIKAIAYKSGLTASPVVSATYVIAGLPADLTVTSVPAGATTYKATNSITAGAGVSVTGSAKAVFEAGSLVRLLPGFQANSAGAGGQVFRAFINPLVQ